MLKKNQKTLLKIALTGAILSIVFSVAYAAVYIVGFFKQIPSYIYLVTDIIAILLVIAIVFGFVVLSEISKVRNIRIMALLFFSIICLSAAVSTLHKVFSFTIYIDIVIMVVGIVLEIILAITLIRTKVKKLPIVKTLGIIYLIEAIALALFIGILFLPLFNIITSIFETLLFYKMLHR